MPNVLIKFYILRICFDAVPQKACAVPDRIPASLSMGVSSWLVFIAVPDSFRRRLLRRWGNAS
jgi:hypothetical protein